jgi:CheY-like chemotaxis protein
MAKILCVDDEPSAVALKCAILESAGHSVTAASSADEANTHLNSDVFDAVVTCL